MRLGGNREAESLGRVETRDIYSDGVFSQPDYLHSRARAKSAACSLTLHAPWANATLNRLIARIYQDTFLVAEPQLLQTPPDIAGSIPVSAPVPTPADEPVHAHRHLTTMDAWLVFLMLIWGLHFVVLKSALAIMPPLLYNALRFGVGAVMVGVMIKANGQRIMLPRREILILAWVSFLGYALYQAVFTTALSKTTVANNALIISSTPVWIVIYNAIRGHERLTHRLMMAVGMTLGGVAVVILSRYAGELALGSTTLIGDLLSVVASWVWAWSIVVSRLPLQRNPAAQATFWLVAWGTVMLAVGAIPQALTYDWSTFRPQLVLLIAYSAASIALGSIIWNRGLQKLGTARTAIYANLEPIFAALGAVVFLGESFTIWLVIGAIMVLLGVLLMKKA